jgi:hypothetical protein
MAYGARPAPSGSGSTAKARAVLRNRILEAAVAKGSPGRASNGVRAGAPGRFALDSWRAQGREGVLSTTWSLSTLPPLGAILGREKESSPCAVGCLVASKTKHGETANPRNCKTPAPGTARQPARQPVFWRAFAFRRRDEGDVLID